MAKRKNPYDDPSQVQRRDFFGQLFRELARPVVEFREAAQGKTTRPVSESKDARPEESASTWLRPPGALHEWMFVATCEHSGACVRACPAKAIGQHPDGTPYIDPAEQPCVICNDLACMAACPSGALTPKPLTALGMGIARVDHETCLRSHDVECRQCVEACPLHDFGVRVLDVTLSGHIIVDETACVGCGCCQRACPTTPRAVTIEPSRLAVP